MERITLEKAGYGDFNKIRSYCGYFMNDEKLLKVASGGAASAISEAIIKKGGCVFGATYSDDFRRAEYCCAESIEDLDKMKGSKYCETAKEICTNGATKSVFSMLAEKLREGKYVLFVGLGCDVGAVRTYCDFRNINTEKLFTIELICHGPTSAKVHAQYIEALEKKHKSKITEFTVRYKKTGWTPLFIRAAFENGDLYVTPFSDSDYGFAFSRFSKLPCYNCKFKGPNHKGDITVGDYWGLTDNMDNWNKNGVSIFFVQTPKGEELIKMIDTDSFFISLTDTAFALRNNPMYYSCDKKPVDYEEFGKNLVNHGLSYAVKHSPGGNKLRSKRILKTILPGWTVSSLRKLKHIF